VDEVVAAGASVFDVPAGRHAKRNQAEGPDAVEERVREIVR
ncbi:uncharacterized, partial [Tachysurus ichikawai]